MVEKTKKTPTPSSWDVVIAGSGPAGLTAAIYTTRATLSTLVIAGSRWGGQLMLTTEVENFPGFGQSIQGPQLMLAMRQQTERLGTKFTEQDVTQVDFKTYPFTLKTNKAAYQAKSVIIATGASTRWLGLPSEKKLIGRGVSSCAPCDAAFFKDKKVIVVGGGDSAMEEALTLTKFTSQITIVHRRDTFRASKLLQDRVVKNNKIKTLWDTQVIQILGDQKVIGVKLKTTTNIKKAQNLKTDQIKNWSGQITEKTSQSLSWQMPIDGIFIAIGHTPNTKIFSGQIDLDQKGYVKVTQNTKTSVEGIFVAGDVQDYRYRQAITAAGFGCMAAMDLGKWLQQAY